MSIVTLLAIALPIHAIAGFILGKYLERIKWNKLIQHGIIPRPILSCHNHMPWMKRP